MRVSAFPKPVWRSLATPPASAPFGLDETYATGRAAIYWALRGLAVDPSTTVWFPTFHCGVEVQAALDAGARVRFYRIAGDLTIDLGDLEAGLRLAPGPVLVIHYFGFADRALEDVVGLCRALDVPLLEDCAHALFSSRGPAPLGSFGAVAAYSFPKSLPLLEGGALRWNVGREARAPSLRRSDTARSVYARELARRVLPMRAIRLLRGPNPSPLTAPDDIQSHSRSPFDYGSALSTLTRRLLAGTCVDAVVRLRREHWTALSHALLDIPDRGPSVKSLPEGTCPLFLDVRSPSRDETVARLRRAGIETFVFGRHAHPAMEGALRADSAPLRERILGIPVHQQIEPSQIPEMIAELTMALRSVGA
jgi:dTDP-4-amino-4,6-dideoxygalactose transaminase